MAAVNRPRLTAPHASGHISTLQTSRFVLRSHFPLVSCARMHERAVVRLQHAGVRRHPGKLRFLERCRRGILAEYAAFRWCLVAPGEWLVGLQVREAQVQAAAAEQRQQLQTHEAALRGMLSQLQALKTAEVT